MLENDVQHFMNQDPFDIAEIEIQNHVGVVPDLPTVSPGSWAKKRRVNIGPGEDVPEKGMIQDQVQLGLVDDLLSIEYGHFWRSVLWSYHCLGSFRLS
jgi:hypothetical protein